MIKILIGIRVANAMVAMRNSIVELELPPPPTYRLKGDKLLRDET